MIWPENSQSSFLNPGLPITALIMVVTLVLKNMIIDSNGVIKQYKEHTQLQLGNFEENNRYRDNSV